MNQYAIPLLVGLLPVLIFLIALLYLDSYKLVSLKWVLITVTLGALAAGLSYAVNVLVVDYTAMGIKTQSRYVAPVVEEIFKAAIMMALIRANRIGFLVDAAILGFAVGAGFAVIENLYYMQILPEAHAGVWIVRGFGTAIMHGGVAGIFAVTAQALVERRDTARLVEFLPGLLLAIVIHSAYNHFFLSPFLSTLGILLILPPLGYIAVEWNEKSVERWLNVGFDADTELLELIHSGQLSGSPVGRYLHSLREKFRGEVVVDMLCYLRLHVELALQAKGLLMMREAGFDPGQPDEETMAKLEELKQLEDNIGPTGLMAMKPFLHISRRELWQLYMLGK